MTIGGLLVRYQLVSLKNIHRIWYSNIAYLEHFGVSTSSQPRYSITRDTNNEIQHSHERPALPLCKFIANSFSCFSSDTMGLCHSPRPVQSMTPFLASWLFCRSHRPTSCPSVSTGNIMRILAVFEHCPTHPNRILPRHRLQLRNRKSMLYREILMRRTYPIA